jgi:hypothetical protein
MLRIPCPARLFGDAVTIGSAWSGLVVGTKLGTVGTLLPGRNTKPTPAPVHHGQGAILGPRQYGDFSGPPLMLLDREGGKNVGR